MSHSLLFALAMVTVPVRLKALGESREMYPYHNLPTANATALPTEVNIMTDASPARFLQGHAPVAKSLHATLAHHLGSTWGAVLTFACLSTLAGIAVVGAELNNRRQGSQDASGAGENVDSTDDSTDDEKGRSGPDALDLADQNHDRARSREEFNAAFGVTTSAWNLVPASSAWNRVAPAAASHST